MMRKVGQQRGRARMVSRRDFLRVGGLSVVGLSVAERAALARFRAGAGSKSCVFLMMTGGPSQFETFDPKPNAPSRIRGPLRAIGTSVPGIVLSESLPLLAQRTHQFALLRSLWHDAAPIHETGCQLLHTARVCPGGRRFPCFGSVVSATLGSRDGAPPYVVLPQPLQNTGVNVYRGQESGFLGPQFDPVSSNGHHDGVHRPQDRDDLEAVFDPLPELIFQDESESTRRVFGDTQFGALCWQAAQLVDMGVRCVVVNLFTSLNHQVTWDCHANSPAFPTTLYDYRDTLCPHFDHAVSGLIDTLANNGLLDETLVVATGEFGRTPTVNDRCGRDHWPGVWSALVAGAGVRGGQVIGASDPHGAEPAERPIQPGELTATIYHVLGFDLANVKLSDNGDEFPLTESEPIAELLA